MPNSDRPVLITGCSSGIGHCVAHGLQDRGYPVFATARNSADIQRLEKEGLTALYLDYDDSKSISSAFDKVMERTDGRLYGLFNNGAYGQPGAVEDLSREILRAQFESNFFGWHELTRLAIPVMRQQNEGRIIQNSSVLGFIAMAYRGAYNASKFAIEGLSDTMRLELAGTNIHVSLVEPGPIESRFRANAHSKFRQNIDAEHSVHRAAYMRMINRLTKEGTTTRFTLPPEAVLEKVIHALESRKPRPRYYVTTPTHIFGNLKRLLSSRMLDSILIKAGGGGKR